MGIKKELIGEDFTPDPISLLESNRNLGYSIEEAISEISKSEAFIGIGSGLSWLSWAIGTPTILISGFSHDYTEPLTNTTRICSPAGKCSGCFNTHRLDPSDWNWCPVHKGTDRQFECSKLITADSVISQLKKILGLV